MPRMKIKKCNNCLKTKPSTEFNKNWKYLQVYCKECNIEMQRIGREKARLELMSDNRIETAINRFWISIKTLKKALNEFTISEILQNWKIVDWELVVTDLITTDIGKMEMDLAFNY